MESLERKTATVLLIILDLIIIALEITGFIINFPYDRWKMVRYYTQDSNFVSLVACLIQVIYYLFNRKDNDSFSFPRWITVLKYLAACSLFITFIVVLAVLAPGDCIQKYHSLYGYYNMCFYGSRLYHHTICPILAVISFVFLESPDMFKKTDPFIIVFYTLVYGITLLALNYFYVVRGPYTFLHVHDQPWYITLLWTILLLGAAYGTGILIIKQNKKKSVSRKIQK